MDSGVKVVGAQASDEEPSSSGAATSSAAGSESGGHTARSRATANPSRPIGLVVVAIAGLVGTLVFGLLWATKGGLGPQDPAVLSASRAFLNDLTNFNAKSIDADFSSITSMATGSFSGQAKQFFNSAIRTDLESALAQSQGQIRSIYVQSESGNQASVYAVVDQVYVNNKISTPQSDVLRILVDLQKVDSRWKIADVTTLEGASPATGAGASGSTGSAGSTVPGQ
jgi:hypothetical protein